MKIIDFIQKSKKILPVEIPNVSRMDLPQFFKDMGFKVGAEIGVEYGLFSESICKTGIKLYAIDPWLIYGNYRNHLQQNTYDHIYEDAQQRLAPYDCKLIRKFSLEAVKDFEDNSLDFVYIDANHADPYITQDIVAWSKKVRKGGVVSGHDYFNRKSFDVIRVTNKYTKDNDINPWFVLGLTEKIPGLIRDSSRSWFWIKS